MKNILLLSALLLSFVFLTGCENKVQPRETATSIIELNNN